MTLLPSPFVIAVSGHRALHADDGPRARAQLDAALDAIAQALPEAPLHCLSALAAGADQLFAQAVLALQARLGTARVRLRVALPMTESAYIDSQEQPGSMAFRASFLALRARAQAVFEVPADGAPDSADSPYVRLADYFAQHADLLVALWDGDTGAARQPGGTFDVTLRYLALPGHAVLHLPVRRAGGADLATTTLPGLLTIDAAGRLRSEAAPDALLRHLASRAA
jgi:hypothetical protein